MIIIPSVIVAVIILGNTKDTVAEIDVKVLDETSHFRRGFNGEWSYRPNRLGVLSFSRTVYSTVLHRAPACRAFPNRQAATRPAFLKLDGIVRPYAFPFASVYPCRLSPRHYHL